MAGFCLIPGMDQPLALEMGIGASAGYDSNAVLSAQETGSGFARYRLWGEHPLFSSNRQSIEALRGHVVLEGEYQDYFHVSDNFRLAASLDIEPPLTVKGLAVHLLAEAMVFENRELPEDDGNSLMAGARLQWLAGSRLTLEGFQSFSWLDNAGASTNSAASGYDVSMPSARGPSGSGRGSGHWHQQTDAPRQAAGASEASGLLGRTRLAARLFISPAISGDLTLARNILFANDSVNEYTENGIIIAGYWQPDRRWTAVLRAAYWDSEYDNAGPRADTLLLDISASRYINQWELFALAGWLDRAGSTETDTYNQTRIECGISRFF